MSVVRYSPPSDVSSVTATVRGTAQRISCQWDLSLMHWEERALSEVDAGSDFGLGGAGNLQVISVAWTSSPPALRCPRVALKEVGMGNVGFEVTRRLR